MDLNRILTELYEERDLLGEAIRTLESMAEDENGHQPKRRGRKNMPQNERREVSRRMRKYWAARRAQQIAN